MIESGDKVFQEVLNAWFSARLTIIVEHSADITKDTEEAEEQKREFIRRYVVATQ